MLMVTPAFAEQLTVNVTGGKANIGQVICSLFSSPDNYLREPVIREIQPINGEGNVTFQIDGLVTGTYSVSVIYDEDSDGEMDTGLFRIPKELVGFSNNAKSTFGPPGFDKTSFELNSDKETTIQLTKAKD
jgi:uncharacterized protein (DUF2141 family)